MKKENKKLLSLILRYLFLLIIAIPNLWLLYTIFTPLTIYPVYYLLNLFFDVSLKGNLLIVSGIKIRIIEACVAGSAYYLLSILNFSIPDIKKRVYVLAFSFLSFLAINILRIILFAIILLYYPSLFFLTHMLFWYILSTLLVVLLWFFTIWLFKIRDIPFYTDLNFLYSLTKSKKRRK